MEINIITNSFHLLNQVNLLGSELVTHLIKKQNPFNTFIFLAERLDASIQKTLEINIESKIIVYDICDLIFCKVKVLKLVEGDMLKILNEQD